MQPFLFHGVLELDSLIEEKLVDGLTFRFTIAFEYNLPIKPSSNKAFRVYESDPIVVVVLYNNIASKNGNITVSVSLL